jgi:hypothetical protein
LLQVNRTNILEAKFGSTIKTADIQIAKDPTHASLNWQRMYSPILLIGMEVTTATTLRGVQQMRPSFPSFGRWVPNHHPNLNIPASTIPAWKATTGFDARSNPP